MKILVHKNEGLVVKIIGLEENVLKLKSKRCSAALYELAQNFPDEVIGWCEESLVPDLDLDNWDGIFHHDLIMASYGQNQMFLPPDIGYVDQLPFVNIERNVSYGSWLMSSDVGGIMGKVLLKFVQVTQGIHNFSYLLNVIAKTGQQNSLFCYSAPGLIQNRTKLPISYSASKGQLFRFVRQNYTNIKVFILFWSLYKYESRIYLWPLFKSVFYPKIIDKRPDLSDFGIRSNKVPESDTSVDVVIPTMGRKKYLLQVLGDLSVQTLLPKKVVVVEQSINGTASELDFIVDRDWPFLVILEFLMMPGVCRARNIGIKRTDSRWVFFSDDDQRLDKTVIEKSIRSLNRLGARCLTTSYLQPGEIKLYKLKKQWGTFGAGNSFVHRDYLEKVKFSEAYEHGYGEDKDFGMQLRKAGCDIIYDPDIEIRHLKAPEGGFRHKPVLEWEITPPLPKPSPTIMVYALQHFSIEQLLGYKTHLFLKYYFNQQIRNPRLYLQRMKKQWKESEVWAKKLILNKY
ncbi:glycosyltransferase family 2 protein [Salinimicrobium soli]|uniref:glycosyltransferase family 2 protein n=1 Tax=Salinimicrobium soli TaxID=1254399 RepID=UPI003AAD14C1